jgi:hypothetical protein
MSVRRRLVVALALLSIGRHLENRFDLIRTLDQLDSEIPLVAGQQIVAITDNAR